LTTHHPHTHHHQANTGRITRNKVTMAAIAVGALALAGGSLALWTDTAELTNDGVATGHLDLDTSALVAYDVSSLIRYDGTDTYTGTDFADIAPQVITDYSNFKFVPEDTVRLVMPIAVDVEGNNLVAELDVTAANYTAPGHGFTVDWFILPVTGGAPADADAAAMASGTGASKLVTFTPENSTASVDAYAVVEISFTDNDINGISVDGDGNSIDNMDLVLSEIIGETGITLSQVRIAPTP